MGQDLTRPPRHTASYRKRIVFCLFGKLGSPSKKHKIKNCKGGDGADQVTRSTYRTFWPETPPALRSLRQRAAEAGS